MMTLFSYNEFISYYEEYKRFPIGIYTPKRKLNANQLQAYYKKYSDKIIKAEKKREEYFENIEKQDSLSYNVKEKVIKRDKNKCRLWEILNAEEREKAIQNGYNVPLAKKVTLAHVIRRSSKKELINTVCNIYQISLLFHERLDNYKNPLTGENISKEQVLLWWKRIINNKRIFKFLLKNS